MADATLLQIFNFFKTEGYNMAQFRKEWNELTDQDKADLKKGIGDGTLDY